MPLRVRRGTNAERLTITPLEGELIYTTDSKQVYVGDGSTAGGVSLISSTGGSLENNLILNGKQITGVGTINFIGNSTNVGVLSNGTLSLTSSTLTSSDSFIAVGSGNNIDRFYLGNNSNPTQFIRSYSESVEPLDLTYGTTNGFFSLVTNRNVSRGTVASPTIVQTGDCLAYDRVLAYDGLEYTPSSAIWHGIDPAATPSIGLAPGAIALITEGLNGQNILSFDSRGYMGINKFPSPAIEALDVNGNGLFSGSVTSSGFIGSLYAFDSTLMIDTNLMVVSNGTLSLNDDKILSNNIFNSAFTGNPIGILKIGDQTNPVVVRHYFKESVDAFEEIYGIAGGALGLASNFYSNKGSFAAPTTLLQADTIHTINNFGYDGTTYSYSCGIRFGVDVDNSVGPGIVPGNILFLTTKPDGSIAQSGFNAEGYFGINTGGAPATTNLDVWGDALVRGTISNETLILDQNAILSDSTFNSLFSGNPIGTVSIGNASNPVQLQHYFNEQFDSYQKTYGISGSFLGLDSSFYTSRGTFASPTTLNTGDTIHTINNFGYDGSSFVYTCGIRFGVDVDNTVSTGIVPGNILFLTTKPDGSLAQSGFNAEGYFGINTGGAPATTHLDVWGDALIRGITNSVFKGSFVADDSTLIIDSTTGNINGNFIFGSAVVQGSVVVGGSIALATNTISTTDSSNLIVSQATNFASDVTVDGNITGSTVSSNGYVMFGSYDATARAGLTPANGMVIYNTTVDKFQGYQGGAWINLDDGSAAP